MKVRRHKTVNLIIKDGVTANFKKDIEVARRDGNTDPTYVGTLNIYGESETDGTLIANADKGYAAIGGSDEYFNGIINIHSGSVTARGGVHGAGIGAGSEYGLSRGGECERESFSQRQLRSGDRLRF
ncbi:hypothetical protein [Ruminococcus sp.]|uniref:hypothetical protein n=1 Tax=Ruminococcus sp. TaxID=41978 RepID=UPI0025D8BC0D|nr:hypothetical protein [Ruminococcus sp.]MBQ8967255.1 hypothetical protein [Ruminococcus sp.]